MSSYTRNHYVPKWYQKLFLGQNQKFYYLDLKPDLINTIGGKRIYRRSIRELGPVNCFCKDDLYTLNFLGLKNKEIESSFFGEIDLEGKKGLLALLDLESTLNFSNIHKYISSFMIYMSVQKLRTPKGLLYLEKHIKSKDTNETLIAMRRLSRMHCAIWSECVWSILDASESETKFIISDHPVTVYNSKYFPASKYCREFIDPDIWLNGTYTIFPLSLNKLLILTNLSWVRNPYGKPKKERPHPDLFRPAFFRYDHIHMGRKLSENEVIQFNYIIKKRAQRYIAAIEKEWLTPENDIKVKKWDHFCKSYLLMPDPRSVPFISGMMMGFKDGSSDGYDEYGRNRIHKEYDNQKLRDKEWHSFCAFKGEFARKFGSKRRGFIYELNGECEKEDSPEMHQHYLISESVHKEKMK
ncbi:DUF4238 domain-containing protein [Marinicella sp. W31]|uniref:DUF4238 domain-containing protein n=1 Tax=Marinicella sp. W31 TaxID=3023713 RepID=UPI003757D909